MPTLPPITAREVERIFERIHTGRGRLYDLGIPIDAGKFSVILSPEAYNAMETLAKEAVRWRGAIEPDFSESEQVKWTIFGAPVETDSSLLRNEIRLRSEVTV